MVWRIWCIFLSFLFLVSPSFARSRLLESKDVEFRVWVPRKEVGKGEMVRVVVDFSYIGWARLSQTTIKPPSLENFEFLGKITTNKMDKVGGKRRFLFQTVFLLLPKKTGTLIIGPFSVFGHSSLPIRIKVLPKSERAKGKQEVSPEKEESPSSEEEIPPWLW